MENNLYVICDGKKYTIAELREIVRDYEKHKAQQNATGQNRPTATDEKSS